jgi:hypothetical protein
MPLLPFYLLCHSLHSLLSCLPTPSSLSLPPYSCLPTPSSLPLLPPTPPLTSSLFFCTVEASQIIEDCRHALYAAKICSYAQGMCLIQAASDQVREVMASIFTHCLSVYLCISLSFFLCLSLSLSLSHSLSLSLSLPLSISLSLTHSLYAY